MGSNFVTLIHQNDSETESSSRENGRHTPNPSDGNSFRPLIHVKRHRDTEGQAVKVEDDRSFSRMLGKAFANVVDANWDDGHRSKRNQKVGDCKNCPVKLVLQAGTEEAKTDWIDDQRWEPQGM